MSKNTKSDKTHYQLYKKLVEDVLRHPHQSMRLLTRHMISSQYTEDAGYTAVIDTCLALNYEVLGEYEVAIKYVDKAIIEAQNLQYWELVVYNYNTKGNIFTWLTMYDKALEAFLTVLRIESEYNLVQMTIAAYANIALIYSILGDEKSLEYSMLGYKAGNKHKDEVERFTQKQVYNLAHFIQQASVFGQTELIENRFDELKELHKKVECVYAKSNYESALMHYNFSKNNIDKATKHFNNNLKLFKSIGNVTDEFRTKIEYADVCYKKGVDSVLYIPMLESLDPVMIDKQPVYMLKAQSILIKHYQKIKDKEKLFSVYQQYFKTSEINNKIINQHHLDSLNIIFKSNEINQENTVIKEKNERLSALTKELENSQNQLSLIVEIGRKITSSRDINEIFDLIYNDIKEKISVTVFGLLIKREGAKQLESVAFFENDVKMKKIYVSIDNENSFIANCYKSGTPLFVKDLYNDSRIDAKKISYTSGPKIHSAIYVPVKYKDEVIGVFTLQHYDVDAFSKSDKKFIKMLQPYLAAAISNAMYADRLNKLSAYDGLTKVYNRREFDKLYQILLKRAKVKNLPVTVYMMDIDRFKRFNDTYGHIEGDKALIKVARAVDALFKGKNSVFARFGGEEFIGIDIGLDYEEAKAKAESIKNVVLALDIENIKTPLGKVTMSIGLAAIRRGDSKFKSQLIIEADQQLYIAKSNGRNKVAKKLLTL